MKFIHISDLHIGKRLSEFPIADDQRYILERIVDIVRDESPDGVLIAGDVYDNTTPSSESVRMLDEFLTSLSDTGSKVFMISGNHDSPEKIGYGSALFRRNGVYVAGRFDGPIAPIRVDDKDGRSAEVFLIPFVRPFVVRKRFPYADIKDYTAAMRVVLENSPSMGLDYKVAVVHQFVTSSHGDPSVCESEDPRIGDVDSMDVSVFDSFDYVALGHLHTPQYVGRETVRYCGTPLKYSASEATISKSVTVVEMGDSVTVRTVPLVPKREVRKVKGRLEDIISAAKNEPNRDDFIYAELTDEPVNAMQRIRDVYPNTVHIRIVRPDQSHYDLPDIDDIRAMDPLDLFEEMYRRSKGADMTQEQKDIVRRMMEETGVRP